MSSKLVPEVLEYLELVESGVRPVCPEQTALAALVRRIFETESIVTDEQLLANYLKLQKYLPFDLLPWEKFLTALFLCTFDSDGEPRFDTLDCDLGRGAGKDGFISFLGLCLLSPFNPIPKYDVDICAANEEQAMRPVLDVCEVLENPKYERKLNKHYYHTKELAQGRRNKGCMKGRTNNPKGRDGMRSGIIVFNEVHSYQNYDNIKVFRTGLGKVPHPRSAYFSSNGDVNDGPYDDRLAQGRRILFDGEPDRGTLPFICCLPTKDAVHDENNWHMANPSLYAFPHLLREIRKEYLDWLANPEQNGDFLTKRMGLRAGFKEISVTDYEKVRATNRPLPDLTGWSCTVGIDYAELNDWAAVNLHFRRGEERYDINHAWVCLQSKTLSRVKPPWREWGERDFLTIVDDVSISPALLAEYVREASKKYNIKKLALDHFRWTMVSEAFSAIGWDAKNKDKVKLIRPSDIMSIDPVIQELFDRERLHWGDNPCLRWAVNNTKRVRSSKKQGSDTGNFYYAKIEAKSRKTDMFMAFVASMVIEPVLGDGLPLMLPSVGAIGF